MALADFLDETVTINRDTYSATAADEAGVPTVDTAATLTDRPCHITWAASASTAAGAARDGAVVSTATFTFAADEDIQETDTLTHTTGTYRILTIARPKRISGEVWHTRVETVRATV